MSMLRMKRQDLVELYQLCQMYKQTHGGECGKAAEKVMQKIRIEYQTTNEEGDIKTASNPRGAGRKKLYGEDTNKEIQEMRGKGLSIRAVAKELGCSPGHVQDVLRYKYRVY